MNEEKIYRLYVMAIIGDAIALLRPMQEGDVGTAMDILTGIGEATRQITNKYVSDNSNEIIRFLSERMEGNDRDEFLEKVKEAELKDLAAMMN